MQAWLCLLLFISCEKYENPNVIPGDAPRIGELAQEYVKLLTQSEQGWKAVYKPESSALEYVVLMKFDNNGTVKIRSDYPGFMQSATYKYMTSNLPSGGYYNFADCKDEPEVDEEPEVEAAPEPEAEPEVEAEPEEVEPEVELEEEELTE